MIDISDVYAYLLVLTRMTSFLVTVPVFSSRGIPVYFKIGFAFFVSLIIFPVTMTEVTLSLNGSYIFFLIQEAVLGLALGWTAQLIFTSIQVAGSFIDLQIGFALANIIDPQTGIQSPMIGNFKYTFAVLLFFTLDIHHLFIEGIISSYKLLPIAGQWLIEVKGVALTSFVLSTFSNMFVIAFKIAAPLVVTLLLADIALGIVARTVPQLNVFVVGLPLKIIINFILLLLISTGLIYIFKEIFMEMVYSIKQLIEILGS